MKYKSDKIKLESIGPENVHLLVNFTLDPIAQGAYKKVPNMTESDLKDLFMKDELRKYFVIRTHDNMPIGRFYYRKWFFNENKKLIDWELNIIIAKPEFRGLGLGTEVQKIAIKCLEENENTNTIFAYTMRENMGERRALEKCGFDFVGDLNNSYYQIDLSSLDPDDFVLYTKKINRTS